MYERNSSGKLEPDSDARTQEAARAWNLCSGSSTLDDCSSIVASKVSSGSRSSQLQLNRRTPSNRGPASLPTSYEQSLWHGLDPGFVEKSVGFQFPVPRIDPTVSICIEFSRVFPAPFMWDDSHLGQELFP